MFSWLGKQMELQSEHWGKALQNFYPQYSRMWSEPEEHLKAHRDIWNYQEATARIPWDELTLGAHLRILDLGCGTGWLSALLSKRPEIGIIHALDSDKKLLTSMLPPITAALGGNIKKIEPIHGLFSPLPIEDNYYDLIVSSSALHHAPSLIDVLTEIHRVLKHQGTLVILNETPPSYPRWIQILESKLTDVVNRLNTQEFRDYEKSFSAFGILDDPYLGDMVYSDTHWHFALQRAGFDYSRIDSELPPYKADFQQSTPDTITLQHFICKKGTTSVSIVTDRDRMIIESVRSFTMVPEARILNTIRSVEHVLRHQIPGAFVECGVWRGGNSMTAALTFLRNGVLDRNIYLYDTFEGMTPPTEHDADVASGKPAAEYLSTHQKDKDNHYWAYAPIEDVRKNLARTYYPENLLNFIKGPVEETIPEFLPKTIAVLRLDTDWYSSTKHELEHLYPLLQSGGICIIDDYGTWTGARQAVDEYFGQRGLAIDLRSIDGDAYYFEKP